MSEKILKKTARTLLIDTSATTRQLLTTQLKSSGYAQAEGIASIADALAILEVEPVDWIITPLLSAETCNAFHLLKLLTEHYDLKGVRVSLMLNQEEFKYLPVAFELGLFSWFALPATRESFAAHIEKLLTALGEYDGHATLTSADFLRAYLREHNQHQALNALEIKLLQLFPGNTAQLLRLAEAQHAVGKTELAQTTLAQARLIDPGARERIDATFKQLYGEVDTAQASTSGAATNLFGLKTCAIVDADEAIGLGLQGILAEIGVTDVVYFADGDAFTKWLGTAAEPSLIVQEWRVPKVSGPLLLQKIRQRGFHNVPILVLSSLVKDEDKDLLREMGVAQVISKPFDKTQFLKTLVWTLQEDRLPAETSVIERKIRALLALNKRSEAEDLKGRLFAHSDLPLGIKHEIEAEFFYHERNYVAARDSAVEALKRQGGSIHTLNLLGRSLMHLRDFAAAVRFFDKAQLLSPNNVERLCLLAEVHTELGHSDSADLHLQAAAKADPNSHMVKETAAKCALTRGDSDRAKQLMSELESFDSVVAYMNNRAVAYARSGLIDDGINLYRRAFKSLPEKNHDLRGLVLYNQSLAHVRGGELQEALVQLDKLLSLPASAIHKKAQALKHKIEVSLHKGLPLQLKEAKAPTDQVGQLAGNDSDSKTAATERLVTSIALKRGDMCCYLIYSTNVAAPEPLLQWLSKMPTFVRRDAIARQEVLAKISS